MSWKDKYRNGTLVILPPKDILNEVNALRKKYDPESYFICQAHISLTHPFLASPTVKDWEQINVTLSKENYIEIKYGPIIKLGKNCIVYAIEPQAKVNALRKSLHNLGIFDLTPPFTQGFIPHMTIREGSIDKIDSLCLELNESLNFGTFTCDRLVHLVPDENFHFREVRSIFLKNNIDIVGSFSDHRTVCTFPTV